MSQTQKPLLRSQSPCPVQGEAGETWGNSAVLGSEGTGLESDGRPPWGWGGDERAPTRLGMLMKVPSEVGDADEKSQQGWGC